MNGWGSGLKWIGEARPTDADYRRAFQLMDEIGCENLADRPFGVLSQGQQQKVLISRARMAAPLLILLDEPCAGLDPCARETVLSAIQRVAESKDGTSLVLVTHHLEEIMPAFGHLLVMREGKVVHSGPKDSAITGQFIADLYDAPAARIIQQNGRYWPIL